MVLLGKGKTTCERERERGREGGKELDSYARALELRLNFGAWETKRGDVILSISRPSAYFPASLQVIEINGPLPIPPTVQDSLTHSAEYDTTKWPSENCW